MNSQRQKRVRPLSEATAHWIVLGRIGSKLAAKHHVSEPHWRCSRDGLVPEVNASPMRACDRYDVLIWVFRDELSGGG